VGKGSRGIACMAWKRKDDKVEGNEAKKKMRWPTRKRGGEAAEAAFLAAANSLGFGVARIWGDSDPFDFIVHSGPHCWRVQVKSASEKVLRHYQAKTWNNRAPYTKQEIDFMVVYIVPCDVWYVLPIEAVQGHANLWFIPTVGSKSRFEIYREAWCLMACPRDGQSKEEIVVRKRCEDSRGPGECPFQLERGIDRADAKAAGPRSRMP
jgi:PD-(D/E)XK endonuclease